MLIGIVGSIAVIYPLSQLIDGDGAHLFVAVAGALVFLAAPCAISPAIMCELFPTRLRTAGVAVPMALAIAVFGGTTPYLQTWLSTTVAPAAFVGYVVVLLLVSVVTVLTLPETRGRTLDDHTAEPVTQGS
jgi:MFS transporter, MHS family, alpha-ketoglutarate permease